MSTDAERFTIGQLAARTGLTSRTIRFWSDAGLVPPAGRSASGYRLYDAGAVARLDLIRTLRELGLGLEVVRAVLARATTVAQVAAAHVAVLDEQIRILRMRRAVLNTVATRGNTIEETLLMHKLARLSARERQQIIDDPDFRERVKTMATAGQQADQPTLDYQAVLEHAGQALAGGIAPGSPAGQSVLDRLVPAAERPATLAQ